MKVKAVKNITFNINNKEVTLAVDVRKTLLEVIRYDLGYTGTKEGCSVGECGACTVIIDGVTIDSCLYLAVWADGKNVTTIEGVASFDGTLSDVQQGYVDAGAVQCGFCTPGLVLSSVQFLEENPKPTRDDIRRGLSGNLCRCTGYHKIIDAVENISKARR